ncbi:MAG: tetraacyldisaccharide 4'-kinase [Alphaproteobacteria bacterium]
MRTPEFWYPAPGGTTLGARTLTLALTPASWLWAAAARRRAAQHPQWSAPVPVVCIGNLVAGGAGKTPVVRALAHALLHGGHSQSAAATPPAALPHVLLRGHGGRMGGPVRVDPSRHNARDVGDEALLHARVVPTWVGRDRVALARAAVADGAGVLLLDDGFQDPALAKTLSLIVIDGESGFGNGRLIPAGPLREPVADGLVRADGVVILGDDRFTIAPHLSPELARLRARLEPDHAMRSLAGETIVAFAGIGRPHKVFRMLEEVGSRVVATRAFADHHVYSDGDMQHLVSLAKRHNAQLVTTAKDHVRLPAAAQAQVSAVDVEVRWCDDLALGGLLARLGTPATMTAD